MTLLLLFNITNGLIIGAFYVLMALGLSLILNLSNVINFAHGGFLVIGGYIAYTLSPYVGFWGALLLAPPLTAVIGLAVERVLIRPLYGRDPLYSLLLTFGLAFMIEDGTRFILGPQGKPVAIPPFLAQPLSNELFFITGYRLFMVAMVVIAIALLFLLLRYTRLGIRIRAGTLDLETVAALGINVRMLRSLNFAVGIFLAGLSGVLAAGQLGLEPTMGTGLLMPSFIAIIVGGIGSLPGTLAGGLLIGVASGVTAVFFPAASEAVIYVMMAVILLDPSARPVRRRRNDDVERRTIPQADRPRGDLGRAAVRALLDGAARRLYRARHPRAGAGARRDVAELPARLHRRALVRPRRLFRARRLWRRAVAEISGAEHAACGRSAGMLLGGLCGAILGASDRAAARRLFRHGDDRLRPGVLLHRLPVELADRRRRRLARLLAPADRFRRRSRSTS